VFGGEGEQIHKEKCPSSEPDFRQISIIISNVLPERISTNDLGAALHAEVILLALILVPVGWVVGIMTIIREGHN